MCTRCESVDRQVGPQMLYRIALDLAQTRSLRGDDGKRRAELRLVARAAQEQHQITGDRQRDLAAVVLLHQREREIDPGRHPKLTGGKGELCYYRPTRDELLLQNLAEVWVDWGALLNRWRRRVSNSYIQSARFVASPTDDDEDE